jgi:signal transduction histidine kinase
MLALLFCMGLYRVLIAPLVRLRDRSHELRTPLSCLRVAAEGGLQGQSLTQRVMHEVQLMQRLVDDR